jgi:hypothetical protein
MDLHTRVRSSHVLGIVQRLGQRACLGVQCHQKVKTAELFPRNKKSRSCKSRTAMTFHQHNAAPAFTSTRQMLEAKRPIVVLIRRLTIREIIRDRHLII